MAMKMVVKRLNNLKKRLEESEECFGVLDLKPEEIEHYKDALEKAVYKITEDEREEERWKDIIGNNDDEY